MNAAVFLLATACIPGADPDRALVPCALIPVPASLGAPVSYTDPDGAPDVPAAQVWEARAVDADNLWPVRPVSFTAEEVKPVVAAGAKLVVALPAGTRLFIDGRPVEAGPGETTFHTPPLQAGTAYYYQLLAELVQDGQAIRENVRVVLQPGQESWVSFPRLQIAAAVPRSRPAVACRPAACAPVPPAQTQRERAAAGTVQPVAFRTAAAQPAVQARLVAEAEATLAVTLPAGARLFVNDCPVQVGMGETTFHTPPLKVGATYSYQIRAELLRGGQLMRQETQVVVRAGELVRISFVRPQPPPGTGAARPTGR